MTPHTHNFISFPHKYYEKKYMMCMVCGWGMPKEFAQQMIDEHHAECDPAVLKVKQYTSQDSGLIPGNKKEGK